MNSLAKAALAIPLALTTSLTFAITDEQVFAYAEANYASLFKGAMTSGKYLQYNYRYYGESKNYLAIDSSGVIAVMGPVSAGKIMTVGPVSSFAGAITAWEASTGAASKAGLTLSQAFNGLSSFANGTPIVQKPSNGIVGMIYSQSNFQQSVTINYSTLSAPGSEVITVTVTTSSPAGVASLNQGSGFLVAACTLAANPSYPLCSNLGLTFNKAAGTVSFNNSPMKSSSNSTTTAFTITGTLSFPAF